MVQKSGEKPVDVVDIPVFFQDFTTIPGGFFPDFWTIPSTPIDQFTLVTCCCCFFLGGDEKLFTAFYRDFFEKRPWNKDPHIPKQKNVQGVATVLITAHLGFMIHFDEYIFQLGSNHQVAYSSEVACDP